MLYNQLLHLKIPKAKEDTDDLTVFLRYWDLLVPKLRVNMLVILTPVFKNFIYLSGQSFHLHFALLDCLLPLVGRNHSSHIVGRATARKVCPLHHDSRHV